MSLKYFLYLSETKIEMLYSQVPRAFLSDVSGELKVSLGVVSTTLKQGADPENKFSKLDALLRYLEKHHEIGTVDQPKEYFKAKMPMKWGPYARSFLEKNPSSLVYFGGATAETIVGLGGSAKHVIGATGPHEVHSDSATPYMVTRLLQELDLPISPKDKKWYLEGGLAMAVYLASAQQRGEPQEVEFVARRLAFFKKGEHDAHEKGMNIILGTPLYVAAA